MVKPLMLIRTGMQIFILHWVMQNISLFNVCEARTASRMVQNIRRFNVCEARTASRMVQNIRRLMSVKPEGLLEDIIKVMFCIIQCKLKSEFQFLYLHFILSIKYNKVSKDAKIRNRYNQVPHLTQDTNGKVTNSLTPSPACNPLK